MPSTSRGLGSFDPATVQLRTYSLIEVGSLINEASTSAGNPVHDRGFFVHDETRAELDREENAEGNLREGNTSMSRQSTAASSVAVNENMSGLSNLQIDTGETSESSSNVDLESKKGKQVLQMMRYWDIIVADILIQHLWDSKDQFLNVHNFMYCNCNVKMSFRILRKKVKFWSRARHFKLDVNPIIHLSKYQRLLCYSLII